ncbi:MAG: PAS domain-containing protein, partial [Candidatus Dadabacteria bacterium]|nr:PAS domain-containing protein [Candidatus Dadabacteria bacterium]NIV42037.1 PAS domain-containing protein [Candidatus Dadabacteria bacterium]NIX15300.1 PAS domain-containing protein [Candidatus Dadabacteria bacterium]
MSTKSSKKTKKQLIEEIELLHKKIADFEAAEPDSDKIPDNQHKTEKNYRDLAESLEELVYVADAKTFTATYVNNAINRIFGYTVEQWLADPHLWENSIYPEDRERVISELLDCITQKQSRII